MSVVKKIEYSHGDSKMEQETKRFNKRALIGSAIIHLFFFLLKLPHLALEHKLHDDPKLEPIKMEFITPAVKNAIIQKKLEAAESEVVKKPILEEKKVKN